MTNKNQELKSIEAYLLGKRAVSEIEAITVHDLRAYFRSKQSIGLQPQSILTMMKITSAFFNWCLKEEYITENPMKKVEVPKVAKKVLNVFTSEEVVKMIAAFSYKTYLEARNKALIAMMADCGLRAMEIRGLLSINVTETTILVNGKGNKERLVFISPTLKKILIRYERLKRDYFKERLVKSDTYFLTYQGDYMSHIALYNVVKEAGARVGVTDKRVSPHTFRHFYSVQALSSGSMDVYSLSRLLGHSDIGITQRYLSSMSVEQLKDKAVLSSPLMNINKKKK